MMIKLEYFTNQDFDLLINWINEDDLLREWASTQFQLPLTTEILEWYIMNANSEHAKALIFKTVNSKTGETIGHISLNGIDKKNRCARISKFLIGCASYRGMGFGAQIIDQILSIGFSDLNLHRISLGVYDFNKNAIKCYEKCGFHTDGLLREITRYQDTYWSLVEMSILEHEWRELKRLKKT
ncbi:MAG: GNAT family protein [Bacteroidota bacterium]